MGPRLEKTVIECAEPRVLATFYARDPEGHPFCLVDHPASANDPRFRDA